MPGTGDCRGAEALFFLRQRFQDMCYTVLEPLYYLGIVW
jgi:hypothetical protein